MSYMGAFDRKESTRLVTPQGRARLEAQRHRSAEQVRHPYVLVMQSTQDRTGEYATNGLDGA
ncbi:MAG: hypothetical protein WBW73_31980, partial [Rhodoplanes sp.]